MICFPNAKINLGLQVALKRDDGFHNLRSVLYPVPLYDVLEFKESDQYSLRVWGNDVVSVKNNLITKVWELLTSNFDIPPQEVHLLKNIPSGSGLGGGSADAVFFLKNLLSHYKIAVSKKELQQLAFQICSDCPFFIENRPAYVIGRGNVVEPLNFNLNGFYLLLITPDHKISTAEAFNKIIPKAPQYNLKKVVMEKDFSTWKKILYNDFETIVPGLNSNKNKLYNLGALYVSMTGSGSAYYGIFTSRLKAIKASSNFTNTHILTLK